MTLKNDTAIATSRVSILPSLSPAPSLSSKIVEVELDEVRKNGPQPANKHHIGASVKIAHLTKEHAKVAAVRGVSLDVAAGEFLSILGPSGAGKTTLMMAIAGFAGKHQGEISIDGSRIDHLPPNLRGIGVVFQHLELFPHMTVADNIGFPLKMRGIPRHRVRSQVADALDLVRLTGFDNRLATQLSGGQQQRVALARAIVFSPPVLLLDEPFGALDRKLREDMQVELKSLHQQLGVTVIHVTHDQAEAMAISDRIAVMNGGVIEQVGTPREIYFTPTSKFTAGFVGESLFFRGKVARCADRLCTIETEDGFSCKARTLAAPAAGAAVTLMLRPEALQLLGEGENAPNRVDGKVSDITFTGDRTKYKVTLPCGAQFAVTAHNRAGSVALTRGDSAAIGWSTEDALLIVAP
jgi:ABC-type Fe3+/spermidine/putrescine transport system ATPase subunit